MSSLFFASGTAANDCGAKLAQLSLPRKVKASGKPKAAKWGQVNKIIGEYLMDPERLEGCDLTFSQVFLPSSQEAFFPVLYNLLRLTPEESLMGAEIYSQDGSLLGHFANTVVFQKRGLSNRDDYYFQFKDKEGNLQSAGKPDLIDITTAKPLFFLKWSDIQDRVLSSSQGEE